MRQASTQNKKQATISEVKLSKDLISAIERYYEVSNPVRVSRNLRRIFFDYLFHEKDALPVDFDLYLNDLYNLFELLDAIEDNNH